MAKYLIKNTNEYRQVWAGRLRFRPGQQMWVRDEHLGLVQRHLDSGLFVLLRAVGVPAPDPEPEPAPAPVQVPEIEPVPEPEPAPEPEPVQVSEPAVEYTEASLKSMKLTELRPLAESLGLRHSGVRKSALISLILSALAGEE